MSRDLSRAALATLVYAGTTGALGLYCKPGYNTNRNLTQELIDRDLLFRLGSGPVVVTTGGREAAQSALEAGQLPEVSRDGWCPALLSEGAGGPPVGPFDRGIRPDIKASRLGPSYYLHETTKWLAVGESWYPCYDGSLIHVQAYERRDGEAGVSIWGADDHGMQRQCRDWPQALRYFDRVCHLTTRDHLYWGLGFDID